MEKQGEEDTFSFSFKNFEVLKLKTPIYMFWACIFLIFDSLDMGHFFHSPFLALFPSLPQFSLTPVLTFLTTKISSPLFLYFSTSATLPPYSPPPNFYPYLNKQANKQNT